MRPISLVLLVTVLGLAAATAAQDTVRLKNGNELTGTIKTMADGKLTLEHPLLGTVTVPMDTVANMSSAGEITVLTVDGEKYRRRIQGLESGRLLLSDLTGAPLGPVDLAQVAQLNPDETPAKWTGSVSIGGSYVSGNTDRRSGTAAADAERRTADDRFTVRATWDYAEDKPSPGVWDLSQRRTYGAMKYDYFLTKKWYVWSNVSAEGDYKADLDLRLTAGVGAGHQLFEDETFKLGLELGPAYLYEDYSTAPTASESACGRAAYTLLWQISDGLRLQQVTEALMSLENGDDSFGRMDTRLQTKVSESMIGQLQWVMLYDNTPAPGNERVDHTVNVSLGWAF